MPSGLAQVCVQLELVALQNVEPMVGQLWDISQRGGCIVLPGLHRLAGPVSDCGASRIPPEAARSDGPWAP
jgi:hypothetical protein